MVATTHEELGRLVAWVRVLEQTGYGIARSLGVRDPEFMQISAALKESRRQARAGLPPWARAIDSDRVIQWTREVGLVFGFRNTQVHWQHLERFSGQSWEPIRVSPRTGEEVPAAEGEVALWTAETDRLIVAASEIRRAITLEICDHVHFEHPLLAVPGTEWRPTIYARADGFPPRPTSDQVAEAQARLISAPEEWWAWPEDRYRGQRAALR